MATLVAAPIANSRKHSTGAGVGSQSRADRRVDLSNKAGRLTK
jgi:hypothetical protein